MSLKKLLVGIISVAAVALFPASALANNVTISGSMEGAIHISNGDLVAAGYQFSFMGSHPEAHVLMAGAQVTFTGPCSNGSSANTLTVPLRSGAAAGGPYDIAANDTATHPGTNEQDAVSYQGSVTANVCGGTGTLDASKGATFSATLKSDVTANAIHVQFHYRDPNAKGKGNYDCSASNYAADVCGASWSGTASLMPDQLPTCTSGQTLDSNGNCVSPPTTCPSGQTLNSNGQCVSPPTTCPSGQTLNSNGQCVTPPTSCAAGQTKDANGNCVTPPTSCATGQTKDANGNCVTPPTTPTTPTTPSTPASTPSTPASTPAPVSGVSPSKTVVKPKVKAKAKKKARKIKRARRRPVVRRHITPHFTG